MIIPDINVLLYAYDAESPFHRRAAAWWADCLSGDEPVGVAPVVAFGFVRVGTSSRAFRNPLTPAQAAGHVRAWLKAPAAQLLGADAAHVVEQGAGLAGTHRDGRQPRDRRTDCRAGS